VVLPGAVATAVLVDPLPEQPLRRRPREELEVSESPFDAPVRFPFVMALVAFSAVLGAGAASDVLAQITDSSVFTVIWVLWVVLRVALVAGPVPAAGLAYRYAERQARRRRPEPAPPAPV
jgi:hypothetical protein